MNYSFEFFPAKDTNSLSNLKSVAQHYVDTVKNIDFFSVTYGAGGSTRETTEVTIRSLLEFNIPIYAHLTTVGHSWEELSDLLYLYSELGVKGIVALRGDIPSGSGLKSTKSAVDLIDLISTRYPQFDIKAAGYPEKHPDSKYLKECIDNSINKLRTGASSLITQFCLNTEAILNFTNRVILESNEEYSFMNITPGLIPIHDFTQFKKFANKCESEIPKWIEEEFKYRDVYGNPTAFAKELFLNQLSILQNDFDHIHIYTLNRNLFGINLSTLE